jgi:iron complex outermembrane receptor protein
MSKIRSAATRAFVPQRLALAVALALPLGSALAQETATPPEAPAKPAPTTLDQIQVTAQRRVENIQDVPMAITTLKGE